MIRALGAALALCLVPMAASAQTGAAPNLTAPDQSSQGPMIVERIHNGFLAAPDFKATEVDKKTLGLAGGYAGVVFADAFFIGAGGYGTVTHTSDRDLAYGGLVMQWFGRTNEALGYSAKMLVGAGTAESSESVQVIMYPPRPQAVPTQTVPNVSIPIVPVPTPMVTTQTVRFRQDIVVFEPEVSALVRISKNLRLTAGAGYRFTGSGRYGYSGVPGHSGPGGAVGSIGLQVVGGS